MNKMFLSIDDLADIAGVTRLTVHRWIKYADLSKQKIGRRYMFKREEALEWLENGGPQRAIDARKAEISEKVA
jgi:excisionase family DNA binding protein